MHAIIKISGAEAVPCVKDIFIPDMPVAWENVSTYTSMQGHVHFPLEGANIPAVLYMMKTPYSYTKEDVVEIHTLGSRPLVEMILDAILSNGIKTKRNIRLSLPGEFTRRAFLHGRIDLAQAEAVMRIIRAQTDYELETAVAHLTGTVSAKTREIQEDMVSLCAEIEAAIDFSDQDIELIGTGEIATRLEVIEKNISCLLVQPEAGRVSREGVDVVLCGRPNVGKSSLINALTGRRRSIVSEMPGTTRDVVSGVLEVKGICFNLMDTAGMDDAGGGVISLAMEKTRMALKTARIILLVFAVDGDMDEQLKGIEPDNLSDNVIMVVNKCDLQKDGISVELPVELRTYPVVYVSALTGEGIGHLKTMLVDGVLSGKMNRPDSFQGFNMRQRDALQRSFRSVQQAMESVRNQESLEFTAIDLRSAIDSLGEIAGEVATEDVLDRIFSEFCIGK